MKGKRQGNLKFFFRQLIHLRHNSTGGNRHISLADSKAVLVGKNPDKADKIIIIIHRLSGSHYNHIGHTLSGICLNPVNLIQHLGRFQASGQSSNGGGTEPAAHTATNLRGDTYGVSVMISHKNTLNYISVFQLKKIFSGSVNF